MHNYMQKNGLPFLDFHTEIRQKMEAIFKEFFPPILLDGTAGAGKTFLAKQVAKRLDYSIIEYNASMNIGNKQIDKIKAVLRSPKDRPTMLLLDELESSMIRENAEEIIKYARIYGKKSQTMLVATSNNGWKLPNKIKENFSIIQVRRPTLATIKKVLKKARIKLPATLVTRDLRQLNQNYILYTSGAKTEGLEKVDTDFDVSFRTVTDFLEGAIFERQRMIQDRKLAHLYPRIEQWIILNLLSEGFTQNTDLKWHEAMEIVCLADITQKPEILIALPRFSVGFGNLKHPSTILRG